MIPRQLCCGVVHLKKNDAIDSLFNKADELQYHIIKLQLDISGFNIVPYLEGKRFRLVDTKISFLTYMDIINIEAFSSKIFKVEFAINNDAEDILNLTSQSFLYDCFPEKQFVIDNTTQLTNLPTIKNHMQSQKKLKRIESIFYRRGQAC